MKIEYRGWTIHCPVFAATSPRTQQKVVYIDFSDGQDRPRTLALSGHYPTDHEAFSAAIDAAKERIDEIIEYWKPTSS